MIGQTLRHYHISSLLGVGGMGEVYRARDTKLGREVAIKVLPASIDQDPDRVARFHREARLLASLNHPHIAAVYGFEEHGGKHFLVLELVEGETLQQRLQGGALPWAAALEIARQIAEALAEAHEQGIIHRDLKPGNIKFTTSGKVKVLDFGLAKAAVPLPPAQQSVGPHGTVKILATQSGAVMGTPAYMSPEQADGQPLDARSDVFSFGAVLYEMLAGQRAFSGDSLGATLSAVLRDDPKPLRELVPEVPPEAENLVVRCLRKERAERFQAMTEVLEALRLIPREAKQGAAPSLAVLPFANMSDDRENEFLADGITEDLITALSRVKGLRVPARTSSFAFKGKNEDIRRIGQLLNVETVLEGSVRKAGNKLRVTAQLIKVRDGFHLWSERYDREMKDVFEIQDDITRAIVGALEVQLAGGGETQFVRRQTASTEAYELYAKGRILWNERGLALKKALHYFELALLEDPDYALAWAGLSDCLNMLAFYDFALTRDVTPRAEAAAERALRLAPDLAEAYAALGWVKMVFHWDWAEAGRCYRRAIELNPRYAPVYFWNASFLAIMGRSEESVASSLRAVELDPLSPALNIGAVWWSIFARRLQPAEEQIRRVIARWPEAGLAHVIHADCLQVLGRMREAVQAAERGAALMNRSPMSLGRLAFTLARDGQEARAREVLAELENPPAPWVIRFDNIAAVHLGLGDKAAALANYERAFEARNPSLPWIFSWPLTDELRGEPAFEEMRRKLGLP